MKRTKLKDRIFIYNCATKLQKRSTIVKNQYKLKYL